MLEHKRPSSISAPSFPLARPNNHAAGFSTLFVSVQPLLAPTQVSDDPTQVSQRMSMEIIRAILELVPRSFPRSPHPTLWVPSPVPTTPPRSLRITTHPFDILNAPWNPKYP
eukprot:752163-Hanusia_phi.AAC.1